jgi:hypothetical protein
MHPGRNDSMIHVRQNKVGTTLPPVPYEHKTPPGKRLNYSRSLRQGLGL